MIPTTSIIKRVIISPREIHFLTFTLQAYEGIATVTTLQPELGLVQLNIAPGCEEDVMRILKEEGEHLQVRFIGPDVEDNLPGDPEREAPATGS